MDLASKKTYFWHQDHENQLISYWVMITISRIRMAAFWEYAN